MKKAQHTPGPWLEQPGGFVESAEGHRIADFYPGFCPCKRCRSYELTMEEVTANGALIKAAPLLAKELQAALESLLYYRPGLEGTTLVVNARAALSMAGFGVGEGEENG